MDAGSVGSVTPSGPAFKSGVCYDAIKDENLSLKIGIKI